MPYNPHQSLEKTGFVTYSIWKSLHITTPSLRMLTIASRNRSIPAVPLSCDCVIPIPHLLSHFTPRYENRKNMERRNKLGTDEKARSHAR